MLSTSTLLRQRTLVLVAALALTLPVGPVAAFSSDASLVNTAGQAPAAALVDTAGIPVVTGVAQPRPRSEAEAQAVSDAQVFAEDHPKDVGYPWLDTSTGTVELSAATKEGRVILDGQSLAMRSASGSTPNVSVRDTARSMADLMTISDDVTLLRQQGVPDADLIYMTAPDFQANQIVIRVGAASTQLFAELARRYGTEAIAVWIDPSPHDASTMSRNADYPPFLVAPRSSRRLFSAQTRLHGRLGPRPGMPS